MPITPTALLPGRNEPGFVAALELRLDQEVLRDVEYNALEQNVNAKEVAATATASAIAQDRILVQAAHAAVLAQSPVANAATAQAAALAAAAYASQAQATNPDTPIRLNPRQVAANFTVPSASNAASVGPLSVSDGVTVTVLNNATWSVH